VVLSDGVAVLNGAVPAVAELAPLCDGEVVLYACDPAAPAVTAHCAAGGRAVVLRDRRAVLVADGRETPLPGLGDLDDWRARHGAVPDEALLAAVAAGWALGIAPALVGAGLEAFEPEPGVPLAAATADVPDETAEAVA
jgi:cyanophycin synthetase